MWQNTGCVCIYSNIQLSVWERQRAEANKSKLRCRWVFQMKSDPKHATKLDVKQLKGNKVKIEKKPYRSPDLNPTEHLWVALKKACASKTAPT